MNSCVNYDCGMRTFRGRIRCPKCRFKKYYTCTDCGAEIDEPRSLRCKACYEINIKKSRVISQRKYNEKMRPRKTCVKCGILLGKWCRDYCSKECYLMDINNPKRICQFCSKGLTGRQRITCGSKECYRQYHALYDHAFKERRNEKTKLRMKKKRAEAKLSKFALHS